MLLRGTRDCVFLWIPKTAGSSLFKILSQEVGMKKMNTPRDYLAFPGFGATTFGHVHYPSLVFSGIVPETFDQRAYKFTFVRDPYARVVSLYNYLKIDQGYCHEFPKFVEDVRLRRPAVGLYNHRGLSQANPQADWLMGWDNELIAHDVFKVEQYEAALGMLAETLEFNIDSERKRENVSEKSILIDELDDFGADVIEQITEVYSRDFDLFGYDRR